jgi:hypothetical protein
MLATDWVKKTQSTNKTKTPPKTKQPKNKYMTSQLANTNNQVSMTDMEKMAGAIVKSGLFGVKSTDQALALMLVAQAEGRHPATIASEFDIIQGRPALKSQAALARFQNAGGKIQWTSRSDTKCSAIFAHAQGGELEIVWTIERANNAGLTNKQTWRQYPAQLLASRCVAEGVRAVFPACLNGVYLAEEVQDFDMKPMVRTSAPKIIKEVTPVAVEIVQIEDAQEIEWDAGNWYDGIKAQIDPVADAATRFLAAKGQLTDGQSWTDLGEGPYRKRIIEATDKFIAALEAFK